MNVKLEHRHRAKSSINMTKLALKNVKIWSAGPGYT